ncbi:hypothetical protein SDC9_173180 [bioreactor metagenome]|uniref:Uncharacterized protein n=1 Tax=bioreactor metagenome TaxID=1076179 RepID=A0A645GGG1_9ZZZZ
MEGQGAKIAATETPSYAGNGKLHLFDGGHASLFFIHRVVIARIGQLIDMVQLCGRKGLCGGILDQVFAAVRLHNCFAPYGVALLGLNFCSSGILALVLFDLLEGRTEDILSLGKLVAQHTGSGDARHILHIGAEA